MKAYYLPASAPDDAVAHEFDAPSVEMAELAVQALCEISGQEYDLFIPEVNSGKAE